MTPSWRSVLALCLRDARGEFRRPHRPREGARCRNRPAALSRPVSYNTGAGHYFMPLISNVQWCARAGRLGKSADMRRWRQHPSELVTAKPRVVTVPAVACAGNEVRMFRNADHGRPNVVQSADLPRPCLRWHLRAADHLSGRHRSDFVSCRYPWPSPRRSASVDLVTGSGMMMSSAGEFRPGDGDRRYDVAFVAIIAGLVVLISGETHLRPSHAGGMCVFELAVRVDSETVFS